MRAVAISAGLVLLAFVALGAGAAGAKEGTPGFPLGVAAGEITETSALLWARAPAAGPVRIVVWTGQGVGTHRNPLRTFAARATAASDLVVRKLVGGLRPGTRYRYRFLQGGVSSRVGSFTTAPLPTDDRVVRFAFSGDADATPDATGRPGFGRFEVYGRMAAGQNDFNVNLGDTIYSDSELAGSQPALTVAAKRAKYRLALAMPALRALRAGAGLYSHPDDHEFVNDFSPSRHGNALYRAGVRAFTDYAPVGWTARTGFYRSFRWGRNLELFFLDERSFRSADVARTCGHDLAPTAPAATRALFATLLSGLAKPVSRACLAAIRDPARTLLGRRQEERFLREIRASTATFKVVLNEVPLLQLYQLPYDRWEGYAAARSRLLDGLAAVSNVVVLTTDLHANLIGEVRRRTLEPGGPLGTGIWEVVTGPVATNTYVTELDAALGAPGVGALVTALFLKPRPPYGLGLRCAATDVFSYAEVVVTRTTLTVTPRTASGDPVREYAGARCGPLVVRAR